MVRLILYIFLATGIFTPVPPNATADEQYTFTSYKDIDTLFNEKRYTTENWEKGIHEVPRIYLSRIPRNWKDKYVDKISVAHKKLLFFRLLVPGILRCNELILDDRNRLKTIASKASVTNKDLLWLLPLAVKYSVVNEKATTIDRKQLETLIHRVDIIPPSLAMAQAADESGWGTSRFAEQGNSLFGQWTWGGKGIASKGKQIGKGNYKVASFDHPIDSIAAYMLNLNTQHSYADFRNKRAALRRQGKEITGLALVGSMVHYSQHGKTYVHDLENLIHYNHLTTVDGAYLAKGPAIELVPVTETVQK